MPILAIRSTTRSLQSTGKRDFSNGTDRHTDTQPPEFRAIEVSVLQVPPTSCIHKTDKMGQGKIFIESFHCIFILDDKFIVTKIWKIQEYLTTFLKGQNACHDYVK